MHSATHSAVDKSISAPIADKPISISIVDVERSHELHTTIFPKINSSAIPSLPFKDSLTIGELHTLFLSLQTREQEAKSADEELAIRRYQFKLVHSYEAFLYSELEEKLPPHEEHEKDPLWLECLFVLSGFLILFPIGGGSIIAFCTMANLIGHAAGVQHFLLIALTTLTLLLEAISSYIMHSVLAKEAIKNSFGIKWDSNYDEAFEIYTAQIDSTLSIQEKYCSWRYQKRDPEQAALVNLFNEYLFKFPIPEKEEGFLSKTFRGILFVAIAYFTVATALAQVGLLLSLLGLSALQATPIGWALDFFYIAGLSITLLLIRADRVNQALNPKAKQYESMQLKLTFFKTAKLNYDKEIQADPNSIALPQPRKTNDATPTSSQQTHLSLKSMPMWVPHP